MPRLACATKLNTDYIGYIVKLVRKAIILTLCMVLVLLLLTAVSAYRLAYYRWNTTSIHYYGSWVGSRATRFSHIGATAWNEADVYATLSPGDGSFVCCVVAQDPDVDWDGMLSTSWEHMLNVTAQTLVLNEAKTAPWESDGALKSVVVHAFGHAYGLADNGKTRTIMNGYTWAQTADMVRIH